MLAKALELNDNLQYLIAKHDAIASGSAIPITRLEAPSASEYRIQQVSDEEEEDDDDGFADLAQRFSKIIYIIINYNASIHTCNELCGLAGTAKSKLIKITHPQW